MEKHRRSELVARWRASGLTARQFADANGVPTKALQNWAYRLGIAKSAVVESRTSSAPQTAAVRLLRVVPQVTVVPQNKVSSVSTRSSGVRLEVAGVAIHVDESFDEATFQKLLNAVVSLRRGQQ